MPDLLNSYIMFYGAYPTYILEKATNYCREHGLLTIWQPVLFAGIDCFENSQWDQAFTFLQAAALRGNLIAFAYLDALKEQCVEQYKAFKKDHADVYHHYCQLKQFEPHLLVGPSWVYASKCEIRIKQIKEGNKSKKQKTKLIQREVKNLCGEKGSRAKCQRANELLWSHSPSNVKAADLYISGSVRYRKMIANDNNQILKVRLAYLEEIKTLATDHDGNTNLDGHSALLHAKDNMKNLIQKKTWHILSANLGSPDACCLASLAKPTEEDEPIPTYDFWIYWGACQGEHQLLRDLILNICENRSTHKHLLPDLDNLLDRFLSHPKVSFLNKIRVCHARTLLFLRIGDHCDVEKLKSLFQLNRQRRFQLVEDNRQKDLSILDGLLTILVIRIIENDDDPIWIERALQYAKKGYKNLVPADMLYVLRRSELDQTGDHETQLLAEQCHFELMSQKYPPYLCYKHSMDICRYFDGLELDSQAKIDYELLHTFVNKLDEYKAFENLNFQIAFALFTMTSNRSINLNKLVDDPKVFLETQCKRYESVINAYVEIHARVLASLILYGVDVADNLAKLNSLFNKGSMEVLPTLGLILEFGVPGILEPSPAKAAEVYKAALKKKLMPPYLNFCLNESAKLYLNYGAKIVDRDTAISNLYRCLEIEDNPIFKVNLGHIFSSDLRTVDKGKDYLEEAAREGDMDAALGLGAIYGSIYYSKFYDPNKSLSYLLPLLESGRLDCAYYIGMIMFNDADVKIPSDSKYAQFSMFDFLMLAATKNVHAQYFVALLLLRSKEPHLNKAGWKYLELASINGLGDEVNQVRFLLEYIDSKMVPDQLFSALVNRNYDEAWKKAAELARAEYKIQKTKPEKKQPTPLSQSEGQKMMVVPTRLLEDMKDFLSSRKITERDFRSILEKLARHCEASIREAEGSRVHFSIFNQTFTYHPRHATGETVEHNRRIYYQTRVQKIMSELPSDTSNISDTSLGM